MALIFGKSLDITPTEALFLLVLHNQNLSGSEIVKIVKEDLGEDFSPSAGATYKIIQSLESKGMIHETTDSIEEETRDKRIRKYTLTEEGRKMVLKITNQVQKVIVFVEQCCPGGEEKMVVIKKINEKEE